MQAQSPRRIIPQWLRHNRKLEVCAGSRESTVRAEAAAADGELADLAEMGTAGGVPLHQIVTMQWYRCRAAIHRVAVMVRWLQVLRGRS